MILEVQHETSQDYSEPVSEWLTELRMQPVSDDWQSCHSFHLKVNHPATMFSYRDGFGNRVHHFNLLAPHQQIRVLAASIVETNSLEANLDLCSSLLPLDPQMLACELLDFLPFRGPVSESSHLTAVLEQLIPREGERAGFWAGRVADFIFHQFEYAKDVTDSSSPVDDILTHRKGVCQDFAHLMIAILRSQGIPARYVSGYIHRPNKESQSHAWCEAWLPGLNWVGFDPTNGCQANDRFVRVAMGRDFTDVPPNKGVHRGKAQETISVRVATRELSRLPSVSWHEHLPPLDTPLTSLIRRRRFLADEQAMQQQQQQQQ